MKKSSSSSSSSSSTNYFVVGYCESTDSDNYTPLGSYPLTGDLNTLYVRSELNLYEGTKDNRIMKILAYGFNTVAAAQANMNQLQTDYLIGLQSMCTGKDMLIIYSWTGETGGYDLDTRTTCLDGCVGYAQYPSTEYISIDKDDTNYGGAETVTINTKKIYDLGHNSFNVGLSAAWYSEPTNGEFQIQVTYGYKSITKKFQTLKGWDDLYNCGSIIVNIVTETLTWNESESSN